MEERFININHCPISPQSRGDRLYFDEELTIKLETVQKLKKMNDNYPHNHDDFDEQFIFNAMRAIFSKDETKTFWDNKSFKSIYGRKYLLFRGDLSKNTNTQIKANVN